MRSFLIVVPGLYAQALRVGRIVCAPYISQQSVHMVCVVSSRLLNGELPISPITGLKEDQLTALESICSIFILSVQVELAILTATGVKSKWNQSYQNVLLALELWAR